MPKITEEGAPNVEESGPALDISGDLDDYTVNFASTKQAHAGSGELQATAAGRRDRRFVRPTHCGEAPTIAARPPAPATITQATITCV